MSMLPKTPRRGDEVLTWAADIHDYLQSITPQPSQTVLINRTPGGTTFDLTNEYPSRASFEVYTAGGEAGTVRIQVGSWQTNDEAAITMDCDAGEDYVSMDPSVWGDGAQPIFVELVNSADNKDPRLEPDTLQATAGIALLTNPDIPQSYMQIATVTISGGAVVGIKQNWIGDIKRYAAVPDAETEFTSDHPVIKTIGYNSTDNEHEKETGLYGSWSTPVSLGRMPRLVKDGNGSGELEWIDTDADCGTGGWNQKSIELVDNGDTDVFQLYGFAAGTATKPADADHVVFRDTDGPVVLYVSQADFADWIEDSIDLTQNSGFNHADLLDMPSETVADHDDRYWPHAGQVDPDDKNYSTSGTVEANDFYVQDNTTNHWGNDTLIVAVTGGVSLSGGVAAANAIYLEASNAAGGMDVDLGSGGMDVDTSGIASITSSHAGVGAISLEASDAAGGIAVNSNAGGLTVLTSGTIGMQTTDNAGNTLQLLTAGGADINATTGITLQTAGSMYLVTTALIINAVTCSNGDTIYVAGANGKTYSYDVNHGLLCNKQLVG